jgi:hypothetical protein
MARSVRLSPYLHHHLLEAGHDGGRTEVAKVRHAVARAERKGRISYSCQPKPPKRYPPEGVPCGRRVGGGSATRKESDVDCGGGRDGFGFGAAPCLTLVAGEKLTRDAAFLPSLVSSVGLRSSP